MNPLKLLHNKLNKCLERNLRQFIVIIIEMKIFHVVNNMQLVFVLITDFLHTLFQLEYHNS